MTRFVLALATGIVALSSMLPAQAAETAAVNGYARASAAYVPANVNPNFDFWPVYSMSETDGSISHGLSGGFWPGFLVDATFFQFGYQPFERALFGVAESAHPIQASEDVAGTNDFAKLCTAGEITKLALPAGLGEAGAPQQLLSGCKALYTQYRNRVPFGTLSAQTSSAALRSNGNALGGEVKLGAIRIGNAYSTSFTDASSGKRTDSSATVILSDVEIAGTLRIQTIISTVRALADGTARGATTQRSITFHGASVAGQSVTIDEDGVSLPSGKDLDPYLATHGVAVRLVDGSDQRTPTVAQASSGALVVQAVRRSSADALGGSGARCRQFMDLYPEPVATVNHTLGPNPIYSPQPPYDQLPATLGINETLLPSIPCPLLLMERNIDTGVALAGATAAARFQSIPGIDFDFGGDDDGIDVGGAGGFNVPRGGGFTGPLLPDFDGIPPVPTPSIIRPFTVRGLGAGVAGRVKAAYAAMAALVLMLVVGRRAFRYLIRL